jgi:glycogen phosphorylase
MKASIGTICPFVNTHRMVRDYTCQFYLRAHELYGALEANDAARAKSLASWTARLRQEWPKVRVEAVEQGPSNTLPVGTNVQVRAGVQLGSLLPVDVAVELYVGRLNPAGDIVNAASTPMKATGPGKHGSFSFEAATPCARSGLQGLTVRIRPNHPDLAARLLPGLICWAAAGAGVEPRGKESKHTVA